MARAVGVQFSIGASLQRTVASSFGTVASRIKGLRSDLSGLQKQSLRAKSVTVARSELLTAKTAYHADPTGGARTALDQAARAYKNAAVAARSYGVDVRRSAEQHVHLREQIARTEGSLVRQQQLQANQNKRKELQGQILGTVASAMVVTVPFKLALDFESNMADAAKTIDGMRDASGKLTPKFYEMETAVKQMGRELPLTHTELARLFAAGGQQGMSGTAELKEFTTMAAHMSVAFGMGTDAAAEAIGGYRTALGLSMPQTREMLDLMNYYGNTSSATEASIAEVVKRVGSLGNIAGVSYKPMTALAATLTSMKVAPEIAATGIKNLMLAMTAGTAATKGQQAAFATLGIDTKQLSEHMQKDAPAAIMKVLESIKELPKAQQLSIMQQIFGKDSLDAISPLLDQIGLLKENLVKSTDATKYAGAMLVEFKNRSETTANALILAKNRVSELGITLGSVALPALVSVLETVGPYITAIATFAEKHQTATTVVVGAAVALVALKVATLAGGYAATVVSDAWHKGKSAVDFFRHGVSGSSHALARHHAATVRSAGATQRTTAPLQQSSGAFRAQARAANTASSSLRRMGGAWKMAFGPVGLILAGLEAIYNSFGCVKQGVDAFIETVASIPVVGPAFKAVANALGFGADSEEEAAEAKARGEKSLARINNTIKTESGALGDLYSQGFTNPMLPISDTGVSTTEQGVKVQTPPVEARTVSSQAEAKKASGWSEAWNSGLTQEKPTAGLDLYTSGFPTAFTAPATAKPTQPAVVQTTQATPKATTTQALKAAPSPVTVQTPPLKTVLVTDPTPQSVPSPAQTRAPRQSTPTTAFTAPATAKVTQPAVVQTTQATPKTTTTQALKAVPSPVTVQTPQLKTVLVTDPTPQSASSPVQTRAARQSTPAASAVAPVGMPSAPSVMLTQEISLNGISDGDFARRVVEAINARKSDVERLLSSIVDDQRRLAYGG